MTLSEPAEEHWLLEHWLAFAAMGVCSLEAEQASGYLYGCA